MSNEAQKYHDPPDVSEGSFDQLLQRAVAGDDSAINELIEDLRPYLLLIANKDFDPEMQGHLAPSDLVQSALFTAQRKFTAFRGESAETLRAWVRQILKNNLIDARRKMHSLKRGRGSNMGLDSPAAQVLANSEESPSMSVCRHEKTALLQQALALLPESYRRVIRLRNLEQLGFTEIGNQLNMTEDGARKLWARAIKHLASIVKSQFPSLDSLAIDDPESRS
jgi:RNA polymerase sigma-70 factor, ECF subfamily